MKRIGRRWSPLRALPFAGGLVLYFTPQNQRLLPSIFSSPHLIPVPPPASQDAAAETKSLMILSPSEASESMSLLQRFIQFLHSRLLDPITDSLSVEITVFHTAAIIRPYERHLSLLSLSKINVVGAEHAINASRAIGVSILLLDL